MGWRTVYVSSADRISFSLNSIILKREGHELRVPIDDIDTLIIDNQKTAITPAALNQLCNHNIAVLLCDEKHNPNVSFLPVSGYFMQGKKIKEQLAWKPNRNDMLWQSIVRGKIRNQKEICCFCNADKAAELLDTIIPEILPGDPNNKEAYAARIYFPSIFGDGFIRGEQNELNAALNYGYAIILSCFNRSLAAKGLLLHIGIHHKNEYNAYNLACDLMEPFRPFVDGWVAKHSEQITGDPATFKGGVVALMKSRVSIRGKEERLSKAIELFCNSCDDFLSGRADALTDDDFPSFPDQWWHEI